MTSKEALDFLRAPYKCCCDGRTLNKMYEQIEKDLEVLEKLKSALKVYEYDGYITFCTDGYRNNKDILEIKEWLEK